MRQTFSFTMDGIDRVDITVNVLRSFFYKAGAMLAMQKRDISLVCLVAFNVLNINK
jgi:hypothetical protein